MAVRPRSQYRSAMTGNAGLAICLWHLARRGWHAMPTIRNARGSDIFVTNEDESLFFGIQSKALSKRTAVPLGRDGHELRSEWWVITINASSDTPTCFVMQNAEVRALASIDRSGAGGRWLEPAAYDRAEFRNAWHRLDQSSLDSPFLDAAIAPQAQAGQ